MDQRLLSLLHKRRTGNPLSADEQAALRGTDTSRLDRELEELWQLSGNYAPRHTPDTERALRKLRQRMRTEQAQPAPLRVRNHSRRRSFGYAAAAAVALAVGVFTWWTNSAPTGWQTGAGETLALVLPDGTQVTLNESSTLLAADFYQADRRTVELVGEAYFEVSKDADGKTFVVRGDGSTVTVLGTAFNYRSYPGESMCDVAVTEGKVRFACPAASADLLLTANQRGRVVDMRTVSRYETSTGNARAWQRGYLQFADLPLADALVDLEHFYDLSFDAAGADLSACLLNGRFTPADRSNLMEVLRQTFPVEVTEVTADHYRITGTCR